MATNDGNLNNQNQQIDGIKARENLNFETNLETLKLYDNNIEKIDPFAFQCLLNLKTLILESNKIGQISTNAFSSRYSNLGTLELFGNCINRIDSKSLQSSVSLKELYLGKNSIEISEKEALDLNKNRNYATNNSMLSNSIEKTDKLRIFLGIFRDSSNLKKIKCENNSIVIVLINHENKSSKGGRIKSNENDNFRSASEQVNQNLEQRSNNLEILKLYKDDYKLISSQTFGKLSNLKQLHIEKTKIDSIVPNAFSDLVRLETLKLSNNYIYSIDENAFNDISCELKELILENNTFGIIWKKAFSNSNGEFLKIDYDNNCYVKKISVHHLSNINKIKLENNVFQTEVLNEHVIHSDSKNDLNININLLKVLVKRFPKVEKSDQILRKKFELINLTSLKTLILSSNQIGKVESVLFACSVQFLDLSYNHFKKVYYSMLSNIKFLNLSHNRISDFDSNHSIDQCKLEKFYLLCNQFKNLRLMSLIKFDNLHTLNLYGNRISNIEKNTFANLSNLNRLSLGNNKLTVIKSFYFEGLENLEVLWLNDNFISEVGENSFSILTNLKELNLSGNEINETEILQQQLNNQIALDLTRN